MTTTNKLFKWEDVQKMLEDKKLNNPWKEWETIHKNLLLDELIVDLCELPTYPEPIKGSNHTLLQEYISKDFHINLTSYEVVAMLQEIQSRLTEGTEYEIGENIEFQDSNDEWVVGRYCGYVVEVAYSVNYVEKIRPIQVSPELTSAMAVLEANGYTVSKK